MKKKLQIILDGYNSSKLDTSKFVEHIDEAIIRAKKLDVNQNERWPYSIGTHVYKIVEKVK